MRFAAALAAFLLLCGYVGYAASHLSWQSTATALGFGVLGSYTGHRWHKSAMSRTYRTYRKCGHSRLGALRIAARYHLGKP